MDQDRLVAASGRTEGDHVLFRYSVTSPVALVGTSVRCRLDNQNGGEQEAKAWSERRKVKHSD